MNLIKNKIISILFDNASITISDLSQKLGCSKPTAKLHKDRLINSGDFKLAPLVNRTTIHEIMFVLIGIKVVGISLKKKSKEIFNLESVCWVATVTGRYNFIAQIAVINGSEGLMRFLNEELNSIKNIESSESFTILSSPNRLFYLPRKIKDNLISSKNIKDRIMGVLCDNGMLNLLELSRKANCSMPTAKLYKEQLFNSGELTLTPLVNPNIIKHVTIAIIGIKIKYCNLKEKAKEFIKLGSVCWISCISGRYDIMFQVAVMDGGHGLDDFFNNQLNKIKGIIKTDTFVVMNSPGKLIHIPKKIRNLLSK